VTETVLDLDVIDAHHHLCHLSAASYPWLSGPRVAGSVHVENGAADPLWESRWIDTVVAGNNIPSVQVVKVDLTAPTAGKQLAAHAALPSVRGVRDILNWHPDPVLSHRERADLSTDPAWLAGFAALREFGFSFDLQVFPDQLGQAAALAADHGDIRIVLDHAGMPIQRDPSALDRWKRGLSAVAAEPNTMVKISALGTNDHTWTVDSIRRIVLDTIDVFGPSRCMFASNFPVDGLYSSFRRLFEAFDELTAELGRTERADLFAGTARRFYRIPTEGEPCQSSSPPSSTPSRDAPPG
jgi:predicted TIM-barrel fold metal-dependent hydrolase